MPFARSPAEARVFPRRAGVGLKAQHYPAIIDEKPDIGFFEVHAENYMCAGGPPHRYLSAIRERYLLSLHGVGLSIGAAQPLDRNHLARLKALIERYDPGLFSEHLAWSTHDGVFLNDLLPVPYTAETLARVCKHIDQVQEALGRQMLLENPSTYVAYAESDYAETDFIAEVARRARCGLLLDVNNVYVASTINDGTRSATSKPFRSTAFRKSTSPVTRGAPTKGDTHCSSTRTIVRLRRSSGISSRMPSP